MLSLLKWTKGFTLVEMAVVIAILGVLAAVATPLLVIYLGGARERAYEADLGIVQRAVDAFFSAPNNTRFQGKNQYPIIGRGETDRTGHTVRTASFAHPDDGNSLAASERDAVAGADNPDWNPLGGTQGGDLLRAGSATPKIIAWTDDGDGVREILVATSATTRSPDTWTTIQVSREGVTYYVDPRYYFVDMAALVSARFLKEVPKSSSLDNSATGIGSFTYYVDDKGKVQTLPFDFPRTTGFSAPTPTPTPTPLTLQSQHFFGGAGDQKGIGISLGPSKIYLVGHAGEATGGPTDASIVVSYPVPPATTPSWSRSWPFGALFGIVSTSDGVYTAGISDPASGSGTKDGVGGTEVKSVLAKFAPDGSAGPGPGGSIWLATPNFFAYTGGEHLRAATTAVEGGSTFIYASGWGEPCSFDKFLIAKFDTSGQLISKATEPGFEPDFTTFCAVSGLAFGHGWSFSRAVTVFNGNIYSGGVSSFEDGTLRPVLWKHDTDLKQIWRKRSTDIVSGFLPGGGAGVLGVTASNGFIYAVGFAIGTSGSVDYLVEKYATDGTRVWKAISGGAGEDVLSGVVGVGNQLFAVGYTKSQGAGGADVVILGIDPATGNTLSTTLFGGAQDDMANGAATDGRDLYVVGESKSFASSAGNAVGQNDVMLLRYSLGQ